jgi:hypothetical protein
MRQMLARCRKRNKFTDLTDIFLSWLKGVPPALVGTFDRTLDILACINAQRN